MKIQLGRTRKAITPVIATVILIAITLIAAVAIAGFTFGLFSGFTSSATITEVAITLPAAGVKASGVCETAAAADTCLITVSNTGSANSYVAPSATISYGGSTTTLSISVDGGTYATCTATTCVATAGATLTLMLVFPATSPTAASGETYSGSLSIGNGAVVPFTGVFQ